MSQVYLIIWLFLTIKRWLSKPRKISKKDLTKQRKLRMLKNCSKIKLSWLLKILTSIKKRLLIWLHNWRKWTMPKELEIGIANAVETTTFPSDIPAISAISHWKKMTNWPWKESRELLCTLNRHPHLCLDRTWISSHKCHLDKTTWSISTSTTTTAHSIHTKCPICRNLTCIKECSK